MILWMSRDAFLAAMLGIVIILAFVGYNTARTLRRKYKVVRHDDERGSAKWN